MYEELVKRMRDCSEEQSGCGLCALSSDCVLRVGLLTQAADAIEELNGFVQEAERDRDEYRERLDKSNDAIEELMRRCEQFQYMPLPAWFPATEEPPLSVGDDGYNGYLVYANGYYAVADYTTDKLDDIPSFHVNGEYEPYVTHYMPLPKPPKEETDRKESA